MAGPRVRGRPPSERSVADPLSRTILLAPLFASSTKWSSRSIAQQVGVSQSTVARVWRTCLNGSGHEPNPFPQDQRLELVALRTQAENNAIVFASAGGPASRNTGPIASDFRNKRRNYLQLMLAADLLRAELRPGQAHFDSAIAGLVSRLAVDPRNLLVLSRSAISFDVIKAFIIGEEAHWQALLPALLTKVSPLSGAAQTSLERNISSAARAQRPVLEWVNPDWDSNSSTTPSRDWPALRSTNQAVATDVVENLLERVRTGQLRVGKRVPESAIAAAIHTSRSLVRDALRELAGSGLIDWHPSLGATVTRPTVADVFEVYEMRRTVGNTMLARLQQRSAVDLSRVELELETMLAVGASGDSYSTGEADLRWQDALATAAGYGQVTFIFHTLTMRLRFFIATLGLDYAYSIEGMCRDDQELMTYIRDRDFASARRTWQRKMDDAQMHLAQQLRT